MSYRFLLSLAFCFLVPFLAYGQDGQASRPSVPFKLDIRKMDALKNIPEEVRNQPTWLLQMIHQISINDAQELLTDKSGMSVNQLLMYRQFSVPEAESNDSLIDNIIQNPESSSKIIDEEVQRIFKDQIDQQNSLPNIAIHSQPVKGADWWLITQQSFEFFAVLTVFRSDELRPISFAGWRRGFFHLDNIWRDGNRNATNYWDPFSKDIFRGHGPMGVVAQEIFAQNHPRSLTAITEHIGWNSEYRSAKLYQWLFSVDFALGFEYGLFLIPTKYKGRTILIPVPNPFNESFMGGTGSTGRNKQGVKNKHGLVDILGGTSSFALALSVGFDAADKWVIRPYFFRKYEGSRWRYLTYSAGALLIFPKALARVLAFQVPFDKRYH